MKASKYNLLMKRGMASKVYLLSLYYPINNSEISRIVYDKKEPNLHKVITARDRLEKLGYVTVKSISAKLNRDRFTKKRLREYHKNSVLIESDLTPFYDFMNDVTDTSLSNDEKFILKVYFISNIYAFHKQIKLTLRKGKFSALYLLTLYFNFLMEDHSIVSLKKIVNALHEDKDKVIRKDTLRSLTKKLKTLNRCFYDESKFIIDLSSKIIFN